MAQTAPQLESYLDQGCRWLSIVRFSLAG